MSLIGFWYQGLAAATVASFVSILPFLAIALLPSVAHFLLRIVGSFAQCPCILRYGGRNNGVRHNIFVSSSSWAGHYLIQSPRANLYIPKYCVRSICAGCNIFVSSCFLMGTCYIRRIGNQKSRFLAFACFGFVYSFSSSFWDGAPLARTESLFPDNTDGNSRINHSFSGWSNGISFQRLVS